LSTRYFRAVCVAPVAYRVWTRPAPIARWQRWARGYQIEIVREPTAEYDTLCQGFMVKRDAQYLRWRYLQCPDVSYLFLALRRWRRLVGWAVFRVIDGRLLWVDGLGSTAILLRQTANGREIACWSPEEVPGFESRPEPRDSE